MINGRNCEEQMIGRFTGDTGKKNLIDALIQQKILAGDRAVAERIASNGEVVQFNDGETIVEQDGCDDVVFFIINGKSEVFVNHQHVATREGGTVVGEMAAIDPAARRSATLKAANVVTALKISGDQFRAAGDSSPRFWRHVAQLVGDRLRERSKFHMPANPTPIMFMGSSEEGLKVAQEIEASLKHDKVIIRSWTTNGVFGPSRLPVDDLIKQVDSADFAVFVFGPDDKIRFREDEHMVPRDNVIFEMGLFIGRLGRDRVFMVKDADVELKIPTDLSGVNPITYKCKPGCDLADVVGTVCTDLRKVILAKGVVTHRMRV
jgi:CRP/FNR family cyclic AMP-dependent transcriptional regulator